MEQRFKDVTWSCGEVVIGENCVETAAGARGEGWTEASSGMACGQKSHGLWLCVCGGKWRIGGWPGSMEEKLREGGRGGSWHLPLSTVKQS